jgi:hypothetical protein
MIATGLQDRGRREEHDVNGNAHTAKPNNVGVHMTVAPYASATMAYSPPWAAARSRRAAKSLAGEVEA